eukprot:CAMPEP_0182598516 /NCGR_PEP_ID=MMETSP1324-20130603/88384_1 /TAXON_ID=236786 /ORGANISM="Florenciella sp., Strain RCC1587" /LENGTH=59 /DNA_ID=CAMNT_0024816351 /DNA_START=21 /DNA_END=200 /DNA_ORIENTATION=-
MMQRFRHKQQHGRLTIWLTYFKLPRSSLNRVGLYRGYLISCDDTILAGFASSTLASMEF